MLFRDLKKFLLDSCQLHENLLALLIKTPRYLDSTAQLKGEPFICRGVQTERNLGPILKQHVLSEFNCKSNRPKDSIHLSSSDCKSVTEIERRIRSSAKRKLFKHFLFMKQPLFVFSSSERTTSM